MTLWISGADVMNCIDERQLICELREAFQQTRT